MPTEHARVFDAYPLLRQLPAHLIARVRSELQPVRAADGQELFNVGDDCRVLPLLAAGSIRVHKPLPTGRTMPLYTLSPGEFCSLSVSCLLADVVYPAAARAAGDVVAAGMPKPLFRTLVDEVPAFRHEMFGLFAARLCFLMTLIEEMAMTRLDERLADLLIARGPVIRATHQALADELGTAREVVSRILEHFEQSGLVRLRRARVDVLDPRHLGRVSDTTPSGS
jgi:CRP/FNR family transcriptional regulator, anaerobic regulatory protein